MIYHKTCFSVPFIRKCCSCRKYCNRPSKRTGQLQLQVYALKYNDMVFVISQQVLTSWAPTIGGRIL